MMISGHTIDGGRLNVLLCTTSGERGGAEEHMLVLLRGLDRRQFALHLACPPKLLRQMPEVPGDVMRLPVVPRRPWDVRAGMRLAAYIRHAGIDLVHAHLSCSSRAVAFWARLGGARVIETPHVREGWRRGWKSWFLIDRVAGVLIDAYVAVSAANADYLVREKRLAPDRVWTILNGIDLAKFEPRAARPDPRPAFGIRPSERLLVCVARLELQKGHIVLFEALARIAASGRTEGGSGLRLVCLGEGQLAGLLRERAATLGLESQIVFAGQCRGVEDWLAVADVLVLPSLYEGLPLAAIEAAAAGCPIVATAVDGTPEIVHDGVNGLLVPAADAAALATALLRVLSDSGLRQRLSAAGPGVASGFDQRRQIAATARLYTRLLLRAPGIALPDGEAPAPEFAPQEGMPWRAGF